MQRAERLRELLTAALAPTHLEVLDESHMHAVPDGAESHFKVVVVSEAFAGQGRVARHRRVNELAREELAAGLHALSVAAHTPTEWGGAPEVAPSPPCLGGSKHDAR